MTKHKNGEKPKVQNNASTTEDSRFAHVRKDPRFTRPKKKDVKITLDERFAHMLTNKEFSDTPKVDKYGRPISSDKVAKELKRYYKLRDDEFKCKSESSESEEQRNHVTTEEESDNESIDLPTFDPARGEGAFESSDDEVDKEELIEQESDEYYDQVPLGDETHRFAVVNLDWDNVKASDLMKVFNGFKSDVSIIRSIKIYPSEFGKERIEKETREEEFDTEELRRYQLDRLKYYYAVVDCDTVETARHIYQQCDGAEFESTANFFDLRFIPDNMEFNDEPKDECFQAPEIYKPVDFVTGALQHSSVKLTWDGDDPDRVKTICQNFTKKDLDVMDFKAYIASSSEESDEEVEEARQKYKNLLNEIENDNAEDQDMEITFTPGLSEAVALNSAEKNFENETSLETYLRKQSEKRKERKDVKKKGTKETSSDETSKLKYKKSGKLSKKEHEEVDRQKAELELLVMDAEEEGHKHFDMKEIIKNEKRNGKKKKYKRDVQVDDDDFEINVNDPRFTALHESHHFAIDPSNPQFKKTKSMSKLLDERQRRQFESNNHKSNTNFEEISNDKNSNVQIKDSSLSLLINSVKRKNALATESNEKGKRRKTKS
ncbi:13810_t:CDS:10 [Funneliformis geosporum]|uniref:11864_t:CDS:1 n=1 Tax=Funneliformis geosporum TaxID=1117311 RepID=A0A9W4SN20_9GLOM|nr:13810_t:CDS:10 [Funneliformis geosporum]CAI2174356.1 11864_t:CDS:10 [Funneliformis geosporum]